MTSTSIAWRFEIRGRERRLRLLRATRPLRAGRAEGLRLRFRVLVFFWFVISCLSGWVFCVEIAHATYTQFMDSTNFGNAAGSRTAMYGSRGVLDFSNRRKPFVSGQGACEETALGKKETPIEPVEVPDHFLDWIQCLRSRKAPVADIEAGYQHGVAVILSDLAYATGRRKRYDHSKREILEG